MKTLIIFVLLFFMIFITIPSAFANIDTDNPGFIDGDFDVTEGIVSIAWDFTSDPGISDCYVKTDFKLWGNVLHRWTFNGTNYADLRIGVQDDLSTLDSADFPDNKIACRDFMTFDLNGYADRYVGNGAGDPLRYDYDSGMTVYSTFYYEKSDGSLLRMAEMVIFTHPDGDLTDFADNYLDIQCDALKGESVLIYIDAVRSLKIFVTEEACETDHERAPILVDDYSYTYNQAEYDTYFNEINSDTNIVFSVMFLLIDSFTGKSFLIISHPVLSTVLSDTHATFPLVRCTST